MRWRGILPIIQTIVAVALFFVGQWQATTLQAELALKAMADCPLESACWSVTETVGYVPGAHQLIVGINAPAMLLMAPLVVFLPEEARPLVPSISRSS